MCRASWVGSSWLDNKTSSLQSKSPYVTILGKKALKNVSTYPLPETSNSEFEPGDPQGLPSSSILYDLLKRMDQFVNQFLVIYYYSTTIVDQRAAKRTTYPTVKKLHICDIWFGKLCYFLGYLSLMITTLEFSTYHRTGIWISFRNMCILQYVQCIIFAFFIWGIVVFNNLRRIYFQSYLR